jgi:hypothetical protein
MSHGGPHLFAHQMLEKVFVTRVFDPILEIRACDFENVKAKELVEVDTPSFSDNIIFDLSSKFKVSVHL